MGGRCKTSSVSSALELVTATAVGGRFLTGGRWSFSLALALLRRIFRLFLDVLNVVTSPSSLEVSTGMGSVLGAGASFMAEISSEEESDATFFPLDLAAMLFFLGDLTGEEEN